MTAFKLLKRCGLLLWPLLFVVVTVLSPAAKAQEPTPVNRDGKISKTSKVRDAAGARFKLRRGTRVKVIYLRGSWYWVKNKAGREAWVKKKFVTLLPQKAKPTDQPSLAPVAEAKGRAQTQGSAPPQKDSRAKAKTGPRQGPGEPGAKLKTDVVKSDPPSTNTTQLRATEPGKKIRVAVLDLKAGDAIAPATLAFFTNIVTETLDSLGPFQALSSTDIARVLEYQATNQLLGCDDPACVSRLGNALGARWLISGDISKVGQSYVVQLKLHDPQDGQVKARVTREHQGPAEGLFKDLRVATKLVVRDLLKEQAGSLQLSSSEEGATVFIDDIVVGVSPVKALAVSGGMHSLRLEKQGFVAFKQDFEIKKDQPFAINARMQPSDDFRRQYRRGATLVRSVAGLSLGLAVLSGAAGGFFYYDGVQRAQALSQDVVDYNAQEVRTDSQRDGLLQQRADLAAVDIVTLSAVGLAAASGVLSLGLYVFGDDPDRYE